jgi:nicotinamide mononucleotide (NMN) deamidase PncC
MCVVGTVMAEEFVALLVEPHEVRTDAESTATVATTTRTTGSPSCSGPGEEKATPVGAVCVAVVVRAIERQQKSSKKSSHAARVTARFALEIPTKILSEGAMSLVPVVRRNTRIHVPAVRKSRSEYEDHQPG